MGEGRRGRVESPWGMARVDRARSYTESSPRRSPTHTHSNGSEGLRAGREGRGLACIGLNVAAHSFGWQVTLRPADVGGAGFECLTTGLGIAEDGLGGEMIARGLIPQWSVDFDHVGNRKDGQVSRALSCTVVLWIARIVALALFASLTAFGASVESAAIDISSSCPGNIVDAGSPISPACPALRWTQSTVSSDTASDRDHGHDVRSVPRKTSAGRCRSSWPCRWLRIVWRSPFQLVPIRGSPTYPAFLQGCGHRHQPDHGDGHRYRNVGHHLRSVCSG